MFHTARSSARTLLVAAGTAGFVALGAGIAGADTLGGVTDGLPLGDLGNQVPTALTEGVTTPVGDLVQAQPGEISAQPDLQHQSGQTDPVGSVLGDTVSTDTLSTETPVQTDEDNATNVGPLDLGSTTETLPLSSGGAVDPLSMLLGGTGLLDGLALDGGQTLPLSAPSAPSAPIDLEESASVVEDTVTELGSRAEAGLHEPGLDVVGLDDVDVTQLTDTVPMSDPVGVDAGENADLTGGLTTLLPQDVQETLPMSGTEELEVVGAAEDAVVGTAGDVSDAVGGLGAEDALPMPGAETDLVGTVLSENLLPETPGGDLIDVQGLPELGEPEVASLPLAEELPTDQLSTDDLPLDLAAGLPAELPLVQ